MIYLTLLIYIKKGQETIFHEFEKMSIPIIGKYNGNLLLRSRPNNTSIIEATIEIPYEIHLISFKTKQDFDNFKKDKERQQFLHLKEKSIQTTLLIQGTQLY